MDNQDSNKKRPFGRDERSGRSFFRIRREGAIRSEENRRDAAEEANARPGYKKSYAPRVASDERRRDERPSHAGRRDERPAQGGKKRFDRGDERGSRREGYPQRFDKRDGERPAFAKRDRKFRTEEAAPVMPEEMRLNRFIAMSGVCSRREADQLIAAGEVTVNGVMVDQLGAKIHPGRDEVRLNGELLKGERFSSVRQVRETLAQRIRFYNEERPHMSLDMRSPLECRQMTGVINKRWDRKREKYLKPEE